MYSSGLWNHILDGTFHVIFLSLEVLSNLYIHGQCSLLPRLSHCPVFHHSQNAKSGQWECLGTRLGLICMLSKLYAGEQVCTNPPPCLYILVGG